MTLHNSVTQNLTEVAASNTESFNPHNAFNSIDTGVEMSEDERAQREFESKEFYKVGQYVDKKFSVIPKLIQKGCDSFINTVRESIELISQEKTFSAPEEKPVSKHDNLKKFNDLDLEPYYELLKEKIDIALKEAQYSDKPLMILIGDNHGSLGTATIEGMVLRIANNHPYFKLKTVFTEYSASMSRLYREARPNTFSFAHTPSSDIQDAIKDLGLRRIAIDLAICNTMPIQTPECEDADQYEQLLKFHDIANIKGKTIRESVMGKKILSNDDPENTVAIVGSGHLCGLLKDTKLKDKYHILTINTTPLNPQKNERCPELTHVNLHDTFYETCSENIDNEPSELKTGYKIILHAAENLNYLEYIYTKLQHWFLASDLSEANNSTLRITIPEFTFWEIRSTEAEEVTYAKRQDFTPALVLDKVKKTEESVNQKMNQRIEQNAQQNKKLEL